MVIAPTSRSIFFEHFHKIADASRRKELFCENFWFGMFRHYFSHSDFTGFDPIAKAFPQHCI